MHTMEKTGHDKYRSGRLQFFFSFYLGVIDK